MEIRIQDYLNEEEIKEICKDYVRDQIAISFKDENERERILINLSYEMVFGEIEKLTPNHKDFIIQKVNKIVHEESSLRHLIFKNHYLTEQPQSFASKLVEKTVIENQDKIKQMVIDSIINHDYAQEIASSLEKTVESLASNIYSLSEILSKQTTK